MVVATDGIPPAAAQKGLKPQLQQQGYFLACICTPEQDLTFAKPDDTALPKITATVVDKLPLNDTILRLRIKPETPIDFHPGQFLNLHREDELIRSYSIASLPDEENIELHIELIENGRMSGWLHDDVAVGETIRLDGPHGDCFYLGTNPAENMLLVGTGSGLAPLWGILRDALKRGHTGAIHLFHGTRQAERLYLVDELRELANKHPNFHYTPCISGEDVPDFCEAGRCNEVALKYYPKLTGWRLFLCGNPDMVNGMKKKGFLAGANLTDIHADPFIIK